MNTVAKDYHKISFDLEMNPSNKASKAEISKNISNLNNIWASEFDAKQERKLQNPKNIGNNSENLFDVDFSYDKTKVQNEKGTAKASLVKDKANKKDLHDDPFSELDKEDNNMWGEFNESRETKESKASFPINSKEKKEENIKIEKNIKISKIEGMGGMDNKDSKPMAKKIEEDFFSDLIEK